MVRPPAEAGGRVSGGQRIAEKSDTVGVSNGNSTGREKEPTLYEASVGDLVAAASVETLWQSMTNDLAMTTDPASRPLAMSVAVLAITAMWYIHGRKRRWRPPSDCGN